MFYGWNIVAVCFLIAMFSWGLGFYGPGIYLVALRTQHGWATALISSAITVYYLTSAVCIIFIADAFERLGSRCVVLCGVTALGAGVAGLTVLTAAWQVYAVFLVMSAGWAAMSGAAINTILAPWFEKKRGLAISLALNGASCGGIFIVPFLLFLIDRWGFQHGLYIAVGVMGLILVPCVLCILRQHPAELGLQPDSQGAESDGQGAESDGQGALSSVPALPAVSWQRADILQLGHFWTIALPFALGLTAQVGFLTHQIAYLEPLLGKRGAGLAVSLTTTAAVIGRLGTGMVIDRLPRRLVASGNFLVQAVALSLLSSSTIPWLLYGACTLFGLGVGNLVSLPGLLVQDEFPKEAFGKVISLIVALNQFTFAFGPGGLGLLRDATGSYTAALWLCMLLQVLAAGIVLRRRQLPGAQPTCAADLQ
jgi:MFS family permease